METTKSKKVTLQTKKENQYKVHEVSNTPFSVVEHNNQFQIVIGNQIVSNAKFDTLKLAKNYITRKPWELLGHVICALAEKVSEQTFIKLKSKNENK